MCVYLQYYGSPRIDFSPYILISSCFVARIVRVKAVRVGVIIQRNRADKNLYKRTDLHFSKRENTGNILKKGLGERTAKTGGSLGAGGWVSASISSRVLTLLLCNKSVQQIKLCVYSARFWKVYCACVDKVICIRPPGPEKYTAHARNLHNKLRLILDLCYRIFRQFYKTYDEIRSFSCIYFAFYANYWDFSAQQWMVKK